MDDITTANKLTAEPLRAFTTTSSAKDLNSVTALIDYLFMRLAVIYGRQFELNYRDETRVLNAKEELRQSLQKQKIMLSQTNVDQALNRLKSRGHAWAPNIPELVQLLAPQAEDYGLPNLNSAWQQIIKHIHTPTYHHKEPMLNRILMLVDRWRLQHASSEAALKANQNHFKRAYQLAFDEYLAGRTQHYLPSQATNSPVKDGWLDQQFRLTQTSREQVQRQAQEAGIDLQRPEDYLSLMRLHLKQTKSTRS